MPIGERLSWRMRSRMADAEVEVLYESARTRIVRLPGVIRKELRGSDAAERCRREHAILERLDGVEGVPRLAGPPPPDTDLLLVDAGRESLAQRIRSGDGEPDIPTLLGIAVRLAKIIGAVHAAGV